MWFTWNILCTVQKNTDQEIEVIHSHTLYCLWAKHSVKQFYQLLYGMTDFTKEFEYSNAAQLKRCEDDFIPRRWKKYMCVKKKTCWKTNFFTALKCM